MEGYVFGVGIIATAILLGSMVFFSAVVAPLIFAKLPADTAGRFIRCVFPWYYVIIISVGALAATCLFVRTMADAIAVAAVALAAVFARQWLMPCINRARDGATSGFSADAQRFARLHRCSVWINALQVVVLAIVLIRLIDPLL